MTTLADRMDGDYEPPVLMEPAGGPIPQGRDGAGDEVFAAGKHFNPAQKRDDDGKWTRTGGGGGQAPPTTTSSPVVKGKTAVGRPLKVRNALAKAKTLAEVEAVAAAEVRRLRGNDRAPIDFNFTSDNPHGLWEKSAVTSAREHVEGILRVVEEFPRIALTRVRVSHPYEDKYMVAGTMAYAQGGSIVFNLAYSSDDGRRGYLAATAQSGGARWLSVEKASPITIAIHEAGHILDINTLGEVVHYDAATIYRKAAKAAGKGVAPVSTYAATNTSEVIAESFADVMVNAENADPTSRRVFVALAEAYADAVDADDKTKRGAQ